MKILVPLDGSELSEGMLIPAKKLLEASDSPGELLLVHVLDPHPEAAMRDGGEHYLETVRSRLEREGLDGAEVRWFLEEGDPAERILVIAKEQGPDWIVMATHGGSEERAVRGSVAERVLRSANQPLLLANPRGSWAAKTRAFERILIAHDGSPFSERVLQPALQIAQAFGSKATLLRAFPDEVEPDGLRVAVERLREAGVEVEAHVVQGEPAGEILAAATGHDLVCLATHGRSGVARWWFGSVAERVLRACERPLVVVRPSS